MSATAYAFLGLTAIVAVLVAILAFAVLRFAAAARDARRNLGDTRMESVLLSSALEEAISRMREQERATAARAEASEQFSSQIVESLMSGLLVVDRHGHMQIVNPTAKRILGLDDVPKDADYRRVLAKLPELVALIAETLESYTAIVRRTVPVDAPPTTHLGVTVSPLTAQGNPAGAICLFTDLTDVVALEEQLRLQDSLARLGELTAGLAHEFRNGLATIHGYGRLLDPEQVPSRYRPYVEGIRAETQALGEIVNNFLRFARPEPLTLAPVDLQSLVARAADDVPAARVDLQGDFTTIDGDEVLLRQALSNLFRNSVEACAARGVDPHIVVSGAIEPATQVATLAIRDNGPGIRSEALAQIFNPFFTTRPGGTGLGLAIVQKVIVSHNGRVSAGNDPAGGALFHIALPLQSRSDAPTS